MLGDQPDRRGELRKPNDVADLGWGAQLAGSALGHVPVVRAHRRDGESVLGRLDGVREARVEADAAVALAQGFPATDGTGHGHRRGAGLGNRGGRCRILRGGPGCVESGDLVATGDDREAVAGDARRHGLGHAEDGAGCNRSVGSRAACLEGAQPGERRSRLARRHHRIRRDGGGSAKGVAVAHEGQVYGRASRGLRVARTRNSDLLRTTWARLRLAWGRARATIRGR